MSRQTDTEPNTRRALYHATRAAHDAAEAAWSNGSFITDAPRYRAYLQCMLNVHLSLGCASERRLAPDRDAPVETIRIAALCQDIGTDVALSSAQRDIPGPARDWAWGVQYALNGSALGAAVMLKSGGMPDTWPTAYLNSMRDYATEGHLARFFRGLDETRPDLIQAIEGATAVFDALLSPQPV